MWLEMHRPSEADLEREEQLRAKRKKVKRQRRNRDAHSSEAALAVVGAIPGPNQPVAPSPAAAHVSPYEPAQPAVPDLHTAQPAQRGPFLILGVDFGGGQHQLRRVDSELDLRQLCMQQLRELQAAKDVEGGRAEATADESIDQLVRRVLLRAGTLENSEQRWRWVEVIENMALMGKSREE